MAQPDRGPPLDALHRLLAAGWRELGRNSEIAAAAATQLSPAALTRSHETAHQQVRELADRGRADGSFRTDLPAGWLVTSCFAAPAGGLPAAAGRLGRWRCRAGLACGGQLT